MRSTLRPFLAALLAPAILAGCSREPAPATAPPTAAPDGTALPDGAAAPSGTPTAREAGAAGPNVPPIITKVKVEPLGVPFDEFHPNASDSLRATAEASDVDGDGFTYEYQWYVAGQPLPGAIGQQLAPGKYKKWDTVEVEVTARDTRGATSPPKRGEIRIKNSPPRISSTPGTSLNGYRVVAVDPDGGPVTFELEAPLPGFTLTPDGLLSFDAKAGKESSGKTVVIVAKDQDNAVTKQSFSVAF